MTAEDKLTLIEYETAKYLNALKKLGQEQANVNIHRVQIPKECNPTLVNADETNPFSTSFKVYNRLEGRLQIFEY